MNRRGFLGLILGTTVGALFLKATMPEAPRTVTIPAMELPSTDPANWIIDANCPEDTIYFIDRSQYGLNPTKR